MMNRLFFTVVLMMVFSLTGLAQDKLAIGGSLEANANFFIQDSLIGAFNTPQYDHQLFGAESWMTLTGAYQGFQGGIRFDMYQNSNLIDPQSSYSAQKIGRWYLRKQIKNLEIAGGYLYDQIGSGIIFRAYEERPLAIDNALYGLQLKYNLSKNWQLKGFAGKQKFRFEHYDTGIRGGSLTGFVPLDSAGRFSISPGVGVVAKTLSDETMSGVVSALSTYTPVDSIGAYYNVYSMTAFNTLVAGPFTWYVEGAYKTNEVLFDPLAEKTNWSGEITQGKLVDRTGSVIYSSLSYAQKGLGISLEGKRTENFSFRVNPFVTLNNGIINFLPPMARANTYSLTAYYSPATQELGEMAYQVDVKYAPTRKWNIGLNYSNISDLDNKLLYREIYADVLYKYKRKWQLTAGIQMQTYNQEVFENKPGVPNIETVTPFLEYLYKLTRKKSLRFETQYMYMNSMDKEDKASYGDWVFGLVEFNMAPHWSFALSDLYNIVPGKSTREDANGEKNPVHYPRVDAYYSTGATRFGLSWVKQVEGIVCTGGVCRFEPAFSGVKLNVKTAF